MKNNSPQQKAIFKLFKILDEHEKRFKSLEGKITTYRSCVIKLVFACIALVVIMLSKTLIG